MSQSMRALGDRSLGRPMKRFSFGLPLQTGGRFTTTTNRPVGV